MRIVPADLQTHFGKTKRTFCFGWEIRRVMGSLVLPPVGFTSHDKDLTVGGILYRSTANAAPTDFPFAIGVPNSALQAMLLFDGAAFMPADVQKGLYDAARVRLRIFDWTNPSDDGDALFGGILGKPDFDGESATFELNPWSSVLNEEFGRVYGQTCPYPRFARGLCSNGDDVGGLGDGPQIADFTKAATVGTVYSASHFKLHGAALEDLPANWSALGIIRFAAGANDGAEYDVAAQAAEDGGNVEIWLNTPALYLPVTGQSVFLERGCNRTKGDCIARNNYANFGGFINFPLKQGLNSTREK